MNSETMCGNCMHKDVCKYKEAFSVATNMTRKHLEQEISDEFGSEFADVMSANVNLECREYDEESNVPRPVYRAEAVPCNG